MQQILAIILLIFLLNANCCGASVNCGSEQTVEIITQDNAINLELSNLKDGFQIKSDSEIKCENVISQPKNSLDVLSTIFAAIKVSFEI